MKGLLPINLVQETKRGYVVVMALMSALGWAAIADEPAQAAGILNGCNNGIAQFNIIGGAGGQIDGHGNTCINGPTVTVSGSASSAGVITMTPTTGETVHIVGITVDDCAGATSVTAGAPTSVTSSAGLGLTLLVGVGGAAGICEPVQGGPMLGVAPLRASASGAQTVTLPTFATNQTVRVNVYWFSAP